MATNNVWVIKNVSADEYFDGIKLGEVWMIPDPSRSKHFLRRKDALEIIERLARNGCTVTFKAVKA